MIQIEAAALCLEHLEKTPKPRTSVAKLKHHAEGRWPTLFGYVAEADIVAAAERLGIPCRDGYVAVRLPKRKRERGARC